MYVSGDLTYIHLYYGEKLKEGKDDCFSENINTETDTAYSYIVNFSLKHDFARIIIVLYSHRLSLESASFM